VQEFGKIINKNKTEMSIEFQRSSICDKCGQCSINRAKDMIVKLENDQNILVGDYVLVEMPFKNIGLASIIVYVIPLILLLGSIMLGKPIGAWLNKNTDITGAVLALLALALYFMGVKLFEPMTKKKQRYKPYVIKVLNEEEVKEYEKCNK
jgi:positive regulator of sigma E activity